MKNILAMLLVGIICIPSSLAQPVARLQIVSGDRRIEANPDFRAVPIVNPSTPFVVRAVDSGGKPVAGAFLFMGPAASTGYPYVFDEFHVRGFNAVPCCILYDYMGDAANQYFVVTDAQGLARGSGQYFDTPSSAFLFAAGLYAPGDSATNVFFSVVLVKAVPPGNSQVVVEYFNTNNGHYFNTLLQEEIDALDAGKFPGWKRSIGAFIAYERKQDAPPGAVPVCRFFSSKFTSHFYTAEPTECDFVATQLANDWLLETREAFYINVPDKVTGECGPGLQPIHRMFNNRASPNHRYVADAKLRDRMTGAGWIAEGYGGPNAVMLCTPA